MHNKWYIFPLRFMFNLVNFINKIYQIKNVIDNVTENVPNNPNRKKSITENMLDNPKEISSYKRDTPFAHTNLCLIAQLQKENIIVKIGK